MLDRSDAPRLSTTLLVRALRDVPVSEGAVRVTLHRMVKRGVLVSARRGRSATFVPSEAGNSLLRRGRDRVFAPDPFNPTRDGWTLLNLVVAGSEADRYQIQTRLGWAGFGSIEARLWLAPGRVDVAKLLHDVLAQETLNALNVFHCTIASPTQMDRLIADTWNVQAIAAEHETFLTRWENGQAQTPALPALLQLLQDWTDLLLSDPGLPDEVIGQRWTAARSTAAFRRLYEVLMRQAQCEFDEMVVRD